MSDNSHIEWTDATWNPVTGCTKVSAACDNCYAETFAERFRGVPGHHFEQGFDMVLRPERLDHPLRWRRPRRVFVNSMSDLFHEAIPDEYIARVFAAMALAPHHTFQVLTKRHGRMRSLLTKPTWRRMCEDAYIAVNSEAYDAGVMPRHQFAQNRDKWWSDFAKPLRNVWLGVSVEDQRWADIRIPALLDTPAAVRFLSCEPLLGPVDLHRHLYPHPCPVGCGCRWPDDADRTECGCGGPCCTGDGWPGDSGVHWVIAGGESGHDARPMHPDWARQLRDQCVIGGVPFHFKQWGEWQNGSHDPRSQHGPDHVIVLDGRHEPWTGHTDADGGAGTDLARARLRREPGTEQAHVVARVGKRAAGRELDGRTWDEYPGARTEQRRSAQPGTDAAGSDHGTVTP